MNIGKLNQRITIEEIVTANNTQSWSVFATSWASVRGTKDDKEIRIRYRTGLTTLMYVKYGTEVLAIENIKDPDGRRRELVLSCKEETVEAIELQQATDTQDNAGRTSVSYSKIADLLGVVTPKEPDIDQRQQGTIYKRQWDVSIKGAYRHAAMTYGQGMKVRGVDYMIRGVQDHQGKLIVFSLRER